VARLNAEVDKETRRKLYHALLDEGISFAEWLRRQIDAYLAEKEVKGKQRKGKKGK
jgi:hypothetical protein